MVRIFIRNGACGVEEFFKLVSSESKVAVLLACYHGDSMTFQRIYEVLRERNGEASESMLAKRLSEFTASGLLEKLVYSGEEFGGRTVYRVTQKAVDIMPCLNLMREFCAQWFHLVSDNAFDWLTCTKKLLGSRWNARIIWILFVLRSIRFNELKNSIEGISFKMLTQQLHILENEGVVSRTDFQENPPHVEYSLTPMGEALYNILILVSSWNNRYNRVKGRKEGDECSLHLSI